MDQGARMRWVLLSGAAAVAAVALFAGLGGAEVATAVAPASVDIAAGEQLYAASCAACHGANLEGQGDWRSPGPDGRLPPPPHDASGHTWHHSDDVLYTYVALGGREMLAREGMEFDSGMPGFADVLSEQEIWDILAFIKSTWGDRERETQAARSGAP